MAVVWITDHVVKIFRHVIAIRDPVDDFATLINRYRCTHGDLSGPSIRGILAPCWK